VSYAHAIKIEALAQLGMLLKEMPKNKGAKGSIVTGDVREPVKDDTPTLSDLGITKKTSMIAQQLAALPEDTRQEKTISEFNHQASPSFPSRLIPIDAVILRALLLY
jgi:hypothetical protein